MGMLDRLAFSAKILGKALGSESSKKAFSGVSKNVDNICNSIKQISIASYKIINEKVYVNSLIKAYSVTSKAVDCYERRKRIRIIEKDVDRLLDFCNRTRYVYQVQLKYLVLLYASININQKYFKELMDMKNKIDTLYTEEELKVLVDIKNDDNFVKTFYQYLKVAKDGMIDEINMFEKKNNIRYDLS